MPEELNRSTDHGRCACGEELHYVAEYGAPGYGQAWKCPNGHAYAKVFERFYPAEDMVHILEPDDVI
jgi:hypothetical protein